jgi:hypothetical protein
VSPSELKLEERERSPPSSKSAENGKEITRTISIEPSDSALGPMENITITRKVSLIPMVSKRMVTDI